MFKTDLKLTGTNLTVSEAYSERFTLQGSIQMAREDANFAEDCGRV